MSTLKLKESKAGNRTNRIGQFFPLTTRAIRQRELSRMFGTPDEFSEDCIRARTHAEWRLCLAIMQYLISYGGGIAALYSSAKSVKPSGIDRQVEYLMSVGMIDRDLIVTTRGCQAVEFSISRKRKMQH